MVRRLLTIALAVLIRAIVAYLCGEALHVLCKHVAPDAPMVAHIAHRLLNLVTLALFIVRIKLVITIRRRRSTLDDRK
jgi:hypothetical protein